MADRIPANKLSNLHSFLVTAFKNYVPRLSVRYVHMLVTEDNHYFSFCRIDSSIAVDCEVDLVGLSLEVEMCTCWRFVFVEMFSLLRNPNSTTYILLR